MKRNETMDNKNNLFAIIDHIGGCGRYQWFLSVSTHLLKTPTVMTMYLMVFSIATPKWWCGDANYDMQEVDGVEYATLNASDVMVDRVLGEHRSSNSSYNNFKTCKSRNGTKCGKIIYDDEMKTIVSEWSMACELAWIPSTIASFQMLSLFFGNLISGQLADMFGRKFLLFGSQILLIIANLICYFSTTWLMFGVARTLCGLGMGAFLTVQYSLSTEVSLPSWRPVIVGFPSWALMGCFCALISYLLPDWRILHLLTALITVPFLILWFFVFESFRWHLSHDRINVAKDIIQRIGKFNQYNVSDNVVLELLNASEIEDASGDHKKYTVINLFRNRALAKLTCLSAWNWLALGLVGYGIQFGIQALSGNFFFNMFLFNIILVPVSFITIYLSNAIGRRRTTVLLYVSTSMGLFIVGIVQYIDTEYRNGLTTGFALFSSMSIGLAWGTVQLMTLELYPTVVRNIGYGLLNVFARIGAVIGPQLAYLDTRTPGLMYFVCCGVSVLCIISTLFLSETKGVDIQDKIQTIETKKTDTPNTKC